MTTLKDFRLDAIKTGTETLKNLMVTTYRLYDNNSVNMFKAGLEELGYRMESVEFNTFINKLDWLAARLNRK